MPQKIASAHLTAYFTTTAEMNPTATLRTAREHLQRLSQELLGGTVDTEQLLQETEALIKVHEEQCPLADFVPASPEQHGVGRGAHG